MSIVNQVKEFKKNFWIANVMEMFERLAYFGVRAIIPLFMVYSSDRMGLGLTYTEKSLIFMVWAAFQSFVPFVSGSFTEVFGYKKSLLTAFTINIIGYISMAFASGFWSMMVASALVGLGSAIFKPPVQGTVASSVTDENSSLGFGLFYWIVNIGGVLAPFMASALRGTEGAYTWDYVFYGAAAITVINIFITLTIYEEPPVTAKFDSFKGALSQVWRNITTVLKDVEFLVFLLIFSGFWLMFMQLWDLLPNFIDQWVDSRSLAQYLPDFILDKGNVKAEQMININAACIVLFMVPWSVVTGKFPRLFAIIAGMIISAVAFAGSGIFMTGGIVAFMIVLFSFGEMTCSPKFSEYIGVNAPAEKKALYMGYANIPFAIGWIVGNGIGGPLYDNYANKPVLARDYLINVKNISADTVNALKDSEVVSYLAKNLGVDSYEATKVLWDTYHPWRIWPILAAFGAVSIILMIIFSLRKKNKSK